MPKRRSGKGKKSWSKASEPLSILGSSALTSPSSESAGSESSVSAAGGGVGSARPASGVCNLEDIPTTNLDLEARERLQVAKELQHKRRDFVLMQKRAHADNEQLLHLFDEILIFFENAQSFYVLPFAARATWEKGADQHFDHEVAKLDALVASGRLPKSKRGAFKLRCVSDLERQRDQVKSRYDAIVSRYVAVFSRMESLLVGLDKFLSSNLQIKPDFEVLFRLIETALGEFVNVLPRMRTFATHAKLMSRYNTMLAKVFSLNAMFQAHYDAALKADRLTPASLCELNQLGGVQASRAFLQCLQDGSAQSAFILLYTFAFLRLASEEGAWGSREFVMRNRALLVERPGGVLETEQSPVVSFNFFAQQGVVVTHSPGAQEGMLSYFKTLILDAMLASPNCDPFAAIHQYFNAAGSRGEPSTTASDLRQLEILLGMMRLLLVKDATPQEVQCLTVVYSQLDAVKRLNSLGEGELSSLKADAVANEARVDTAITQFDRFTDDELWGLILRDGSDRRSSFTREMLNILAEKSLRGDPNCIPYWSKFSIEELMNLAAPELSSMAPEAQAQVVGNLSLLISAVVVSIHGQIKASQAPHRLKVVCTFAEGSLRKNPQAVMLGLPWLLAADDYRKADAAYSGFSAELEAAYAAEQRALVEAQAASRAERLERLRTLLASAEEQDAGDSADEGDVPPVSAYFPAASKPDSGAILDVLFDFGLHDGGAPAVPFETQEEMKARLCVPSSSRGFTVGDHFYWQVITGENDLLLAGSDKSLSYFCEEALRDASLFLTRFICLTSGAVLSKNITALIGHMDRADSCLTALVDLISTTGQARYIGRAHNLISNFYGRCEDLAWSRLKSVPWEKWAWFTHAIERNAHYSAGANERGVTSAGRNLTATQLFASNLAGRAESAVHQVDRNVRERERLLRSGLLKTKPGHVPGTSLKKQDTDAGSYFKSRLVKAAKRAASIKKDIPRGRPISGSMTFAGAHAAVSDGCGMPASPEGS